MGASNSKNQSIQRGKVNITQDFSGTCDVTCQNSMKDINVTVVNSTVGGSIDIDQTCSTNANCLINNNMDATSDVIFKATNTSNASGAWSAFSLDPFDFETAENLSRQVLKDKINQRAVETCKISSYNQMDNVSIFAENSTIGGNISVTQDASTLGNCYLDSTMTASAYASGQTTNVATSGKQKKSSKFGNKSKLAKIGIYIAIAVVVVIVLVITAKVISVVYNKRKAAARTVV